MKFGIWGLAGAGKTTVFEALTGQSATGARTEEEHIGTVSVPDARLDFLSRLYQPEKTLHAQVSYFLPGSAGKRSGEIPPGIRECDALLHVLRNFTLYGGPPPDLQQDFLAVDEEMVLADLAIVEKRLGRMELDGKRGVKIDPEELVRLQECQQLLSEGCPRRQRPALAAAPVLRGYALVSAKPMLVVCNNADEDETLPPLPDAVARERSMVIRGRLEQELIQMSAEEAAEFLAEFNIAASATDRVIQSSYEVLDLISFFTVLSNEVRAWTVPRGTAAPAAAGVIHTDMQAGFIRAEVVAFDKLQNAGDYKEAKKQGIVRLEGKTYEVQDGDVIQFRFNV